MQKKSSIAKSIAKNSKYWNIAVFVLFCNILLYKIFVWTNIRCFMSLLCINMYYFMLCRVNIWYVVLLYVFSCWCLILYGVLCYFLFIFAVLVVIRGGSNSIVLQYYCKVFQYFGIATSQSIAISIAKSQIIPILIAKFSSIAKSIAIFFKYCKKYCKIWKYCKKYCKIQKYCKISRSRKNFQLWYSLLNFDW